MQFNVNRGAAVAAILLITAGCAHRPSSPLAGPAETSAPGVTTTSAAPASPPAMPAPASPMANAVGPKPASPVAGAAAPAPVAPVPGTAAEPGKAPATTLADLSKPGGSPAVVPVQGVRLAFKFKPGDHRSYDVALTQSLSLGLPMTAGASEAGMSPGAMSINVNGSLQFDHEVKSSAASGEARVLTRVDNGDVHVTSPVTGTVDVHIENGTTTSTVNGQAPPGNPQLGAMLPQIQSRVLRLTPTGKVLKDTSTAPEDPSGVMAAAAMAQNQVSGGYGMLVLPKNPVKPGDSWTEAETSNVPVPGGKGHFVKTTGKTRYTLRKLVQQDGHQVAVIDSVSTTTAPHASVKGKNAIMKIDKFVQRITGTTQFDVDDGAVLAGDYKIEVEREISSTPKAAPAAGTTGAPPMNVGASTLSWNQSGTIQVKRKAVATSRGH